jgi:hypothetical protein
MSTVCSLYKLCIECGKIYQNNGTKHNCGEVFCRTCKIVHNPKRGCYIKQIKNKQRKPYRIIAYDFETTQNIELYAGIYEHKVNYCSARCLNFFSYYKDILELFVHYALIILMTIVQFAELKGKKHGMILMTEIHLKILQIGF